MIPASSARASSRSSTKSIAHAGDEQDFREESKLIKIDEQRFEKLVGLTLFHAINRGNPVTLAYRGFEIGDPAIDKKVMAWITNEFGFENSTKDPMRGVTAKRLWAEALVERYSGVPTPTQWASNPIASRLKAEDDASWREQVIRLTSEAVLKRLKR